MRNNSQLLAISDQQRAFQKIKIVEGLTGSNYTPEPFNSPIISIFRLTLFLVGASCARDAPVKMLKIVKRVRV